MVTVSNGVGESGNSNEASATPIALPRGLTITPGNAQVTLGWSIVAGATGYRVKYGTSTGAYPNSVSVAGNSATVTGLAGGTTYYFVVSGTNTVGESDLSAPGATTYTVVRGTTSGSYPDTIASGTLWGLQTRRSPKGKG